MYRRVPEFLCHVKFKTSLPEPCIDSRFIRIDPTMTPYAAYMATTIEQHHQYESPFDLLKTPLMDFVDLDKFKPGLNEYLPVEDEIF